MPDRDTDTIRNNALLAHYGLRPTILGIPDDRQPCCVLDCPAPTARTLFLEVNAADEYDGQAIRLFLCAEHAEHIEAITRPKPVAARYFFPDLHLDSIPQEAREIARQHIGRTIALHCQEHGLHPTGEPEWEWQFGHVPNSRGGYTDGTMLTGTVRVAPATP